MVERSESGWGVSCAVKPISFAISPQPAAFDVRPLPSGTFGGGIGVSYSTPAQFDRMPKVNSKTAVSRHSFLGCAWRVRAAAETGLLVFVRHVAVARIAQY